MDDVNVTDMGYFESNSTQKVNRDQIQFVVSSLTNYLHLMRRRRRLSTLTLMSSTRRRRIHERKEQRLLAQLTSFFDFVDDLHMFLDLFDDEYSSELSTELEVERGEAYTLWHDMCDTVDAATQVHTCSLKLVHALDTYARAITLEDKHRSMTMARHELQHLQHELQFAISRSRADVLKALNVVDRMFGNCASEMRLLQTKLNCVQ